MTNPTASAPLAPGSLDGVRALVTGSSRGIGADTASLLAAAGAKVVVNFRNKEKRALQLVDKIEAAGGTAIAIGAARHPDRDVIVDDVNHAPTDVLGAVNLDYQSALNADEVQYVIFEWVLAAEFDSELFIAQASP